ncbi:MAG: dihydrofolate reductase [Lachnospiraceae bacterium]|nr:dihydrofolate reductase [Lachnospiraceae bacterium]
MKMIVAADKNWGIGRGGDLLIHIPGDMEFFKSQTMGNAVVMGRKTFESFPGKKALPGRTNIVLTGNTGWQGDGAVVVHSMEELDRKLEMYDADRIYIIGGGQVYWEFLDRCDTVYVTHVEADFEADTWFPDLEADGRFVMEETLSEDSWHGIAYRICRWKKKNRF